MRMTSRNESEASFTDSQRTDPSRINVTLSGAVVDMLRRLASEKDTSVADVIRKALALQVFVTDEQAKGAQLVLRQKNGELETVRFVDAPSK